MTRQDQKKRFRKLAFLAVAAVAGAGVAAPFFFDTSLSELSLNSAAVIAATHDSYTLTAPVPLPLLPNVMIEAGRLSVAGTDAVATKSGAEMLALLSAGKAKILLDDAVLSITSTQSSGLAGERALNTLAPVLSALMKLSFSNLEMRNALVQLGRGANALGTFKKVTLEVSKVDSGRARVVGSFEFRNKPVKFDIVLGTNAELQEGQEKATIGRTLDVKITSDMLNVTANGTLSAGDQPMLSSAASTVTVPDLRALARWVGLDLGSGHGLKKFEARGPMEFSSRAVAFSDATFVVDDNEATGALAFKWLGGKRPSIEGTLAFNSFDIAAFTDSASVAQTKASSPFTVSHYFVIPLSQPHLFPILNVIDADLRISAARISLAAMRYGRGAASFSLKDGILLADLAELELGNGGHCGGQFAFEVRDNVPHYSLRGKIESIDMSVLSNAFWSYAVLSGSGDVTLDVKASGEPNKTLVGTLNGKIAVRQVGAGQIGLDLKTLAATTRAQVQTGWGGATRSQTAIEGLSAEFSMVDGRLIANRVQARAGDAALRAEGTIDFTDRAGDVKVWITHPANRPETVESRATTADATAPAAPPTAASAPSNTPAKSAAEPHAPGGGLHMLGPLDAPEIRFIPLDLPPSDANDPAMLPVAPAASAGKG